MASNNFGSLEFYQYQKKITMENLDIIILTTILSTLFIVFGTLMYKEFSKVDENTHKTSINGGPRVYLMKLMAQLFDEDLIPKKEKQIIFKTIKKTISDMESDGVYFPDDVREKLKEYRDELNCAYSGLPSVSSYEE
jgi:hypothetical protein